MGNCSWKGIAGDDDDVIRIMTDSGGIMEFEGPSPVFFVVKDFPGYGIFQSGNVSVPLFHHEQLFNGRLYYLRPLDKEKMILNVEESEGFDCELGNQTAAPRLSSGRASDLLTNLTAVRFRRPTLEVLPSEGNGVWKVKLVISAEQLTEILSEQVNVEALIEKMRTVATAAEASPKRLKGAWGVGWRPNLSRICAMPCEDSK